MGNTVFTHTDKNRQVPDPCCSHSRQVQIIERGETFVVMVRQSCK